MEGVRGEFFRCEKLKATLSTKACQGNYRQAMSPRGLDYGLRPQCRGCPLGAFHAGLVPETASSSRFLGRLICSRCHESARRLIRKSICVSCYNREREVAIGRNAKGGAPVNCRQVSSATLACLIGEEATMRVQRFDRVTSRVEAVLSMVRTETKAVAFGWVAPPIVREGRNVGIAA